MKTTRSLFLKGDLIKLSKSGSQISLAGLLLIRDYLILSKGNFIMIRVSNNNLGPTTSRAGIITSPDASDQEVTEVETLGSF